MNKETYSKEAMKFAAYDDKMYPFWAVLEELGEFAGKIAKSLRGDKELDMEALRKEAGDVLWQLNAKQVEQKSMELYDSKYCDFSDIVREVASDEMSADWVAQQFEEFIGTHFSMNPDEIRQENIDKLTDRKNRGKIKGDGDNR